LGCRGWRGERVRREGMEEREKRKGEKHVSLVAHSIGCPSIPHPPATKLATSKKYPLRLPTNAEILQRIETSPTYPGREIHPPYYRGRSIYSISTKPLKQTRRHKDRFGTPVLSHPILPYPPLVSNFQPSFPFPLPSTRDPPHINRGDDLHPTL
jgi:hypothetical protein